MHVEVQPENCKNSNEGESVKFLIYLNAFQSVSWLFSLCI